MTKLLKQKINMRCIECRSKFTPKKFLEKHCENCKEAEREYQSGKMAKTTAPKKPLNKISDKRKIDNLKYLAQRIVFLGKKENQICPITKTPTTDVHHKKGRVGSLYLDETHWVALSREGHKFVEEHPEWSKENGYSLNRL